MSRDSGTTWIFGDDAFREIAQCLGSPDAFWSQSRQIDIAVALDELAAWSTDSRDYDERMHKSGWESAAKDFMIAYDALGPKTKSFTEASAGAALRLCEGDLGQHTDDVQLLRESLAKLRDILASPDALQRLKG